MPEIAEERPPYVSFERRALEDRTKQIADGVWATVDADFALITPAGSRDQIERKVSEWFEYLKKSVREERFREDWLQGYQRAYEAWKNNQELPLEGTPIKTWNVLSPAQQQNFLNVNIRTVEDLAAASDSAMELFGMGALALRERARAYLSASKEPAKLAAQLTDLAQKLETLTSALAQKDREIEALKAAAKK